MTTKWCEKCSIEFEPKYIINEISNDYTIQLIEYELEKCPRCGGELIALEGR